MSSKSFQSRCSNLRKLSVILQQKWQFGPITVCPRCRARLASTSPIQENIDDVTQQEELDDRINEDVSVEEEDNELSDTDNNDIPNFPVI